MKDDINDTMRTEGTLGVVRRHDKAARFEGVSIDDFYAYMPMHSDIFAPSREMWPASSVRARIPPVTVRGSDGPKLISAANGWTATGRSSR